MKPNVYHGENPNFSGRSLLSRRTTIFSPLPARRPSLLHPPPSAQGPLGALDCAPPRALPRASRLVSRPDLHRQWRTQRLGRAWTQVAVGRAALVPCLGKLHIGHAEGYFFLPSSTARMVYLSLGARGGAQGCRALGPPLCAARVFLRPYCSAQPGDPAKQASKGVR